MERPVNKSWFARYLRLIAGESTDNRRVVLEDCAELLEGLMCDLEAFESVASSPGAVEDMAIEINRLTERLAQAERERDAMHRDMKLYCRCKACKKFVDGEDCPVHAECTYGNEGLFEWRGVCPENTKEGQA